MQKMRPEVIIVCIHHRANPDVPSCGARGAEAIASRLAHELDARGLPLRLERFDCLGKCELGPNLKISPGGDFCHGVTLNSIPQLLEQIASTL